MTLVDRLLQQPGAWGAPEADELVAMSSRIRLARNLDGSPFPDWADEDTRQRLWEEIADVLRGLPETADLEIVPMEGLAPVDRQVLRERHLISTEMAERARGAGVAVRPDERVAIMVNEEDHLRIQCMGPGLTVEELWGRIDALDNALERVLPYAFSPRLGYLTACPSNVGTGLRASVMLHLPGLRLANEIDPVVKGLGKVGLAVRGLLGEGTEAFGNMFQISNQSSLGETEATIIRRLRQIVLEVMEHERHARARLLEDRREFLRDRVGRAFGVLTHARLLPSGEALDLLSALRLGVEIGMVRGTDRGAIDRTMLLTQPGHLQKIMQRVLRPEERDMIRARITRERMAGAELVEM